MKQYWPARIPYGENKGYTIGISWEAEIAFKLLSTYGAIAGKRGSISGSTSDPGIDLQTPEELVERCFTIARLFAEKALSLGMIEEEEKEDAIRDPKG